MAIVLDGTTGITTPDLTDTSLTAGRVVYAGTSGNLTGSTALTFDGAILGVNGISVGRGAGAVATTTAVGASALAANSSGGNNVAIGYQAGLANSTGGQSTLIGSQAGLAGTDLDYVTAVGYQALSSITSGDFNTALGAQALKSNTSGASQTAVGYQAGYSVTGTTNSFFGDRAGQNLTTGTNNTGIGAYTINGTSGSGTYNVAVGQGAMNANTSGGLNVSVGSQALQANTTASSNTAVGYQAGYTATTNSYNVFLGYQAGYTSNYNGNGFNTCVGVQTGYSLTTGTGNTFIGGANSASGYFVTSGSNNTILGGYNGNAGGLDIRTASNYIVLSDGAGNPRLYSDASGRIRIGGVSGGNDIFRALQTTANSVATFENSNATPTGASVYFSGASPNNTTQDFLNCGDTTNAKLYIYSNGTVTNRTGTYNSFSDIKLKQDIVDAGSQWEDIKSVRVRKFRLKDDVLANPESKPLIGVIAQELELTSAGLVEDCIEREGQTTKAVKYSILYMKSVKALQEAMERIEQLEARLDAANL
jgi:hypothetical protein